MSRFVDQVVRSKGSYMILRRMASRKSSRVPIPRSLPGARKSQSLFTKWVLLSVPATTFGLGVWQVRRRTWKNDLIARLNEKTGGTSRQLPEADQHIDWKELEYSKIIVSGEFDHQKELYVEPRRFNPPSESEGGTLITSKPRVGVHVVTPFYLPERGYSILINRGYVDMDHKDPKTRQAGQIQGDTEITGLLRLTENVRMRPNNNIELNQWGFVDIEKMAEVTGCRPILLDAIAECSVEGGPIGGQTRIRLWNHHIDYIITWFSLSAITSAMWCSKYMRRVPVL